MKNKERFDAVAFMRAVRDRMSKEMSGMTPQERISYIRKKAARLEERRLAEAGGSRRCVTD